MKRFKKPLIILAILIVLILLFILYGFYNFNKMLKSGVRTRSVPSTQDGAVKIANYYEEYLNTFIKNITMGDFKTSYNMMTEESKKTTSLDRFSSVMSEIIGVSNRSIAVDKITPAKVTLGGITLPVVRVEGILSGDNQRVQFDLLERVSGLEVVFFNVL